MWEARGLISTSKSASLGAKIESKIRIICTGEVGAREAEKEAGLECSEYTNCVFPG